MIQLKVPLGFGASLPHGPPNRDGEKKEEANEQQGNDYSGQITKIEKSCVTLQVVEGKKRQTAAAERME